jgi:hypothetical protein
VDPLAGKYPTVGGMVYCVGNPVLYIDKDGNWPRKGVNIFFAKVSAGVGVMYATAANYKRGVATDRYGMTHFSGYSTKHVTNQNLYDSSPNPSYIVGGGINASVGFERNTNADSFVQSTKSNSSDISVSIKGIVGGSVGVGDDVFSLSVGVGAEIGISGDEFKLIESISLSKQESKQAGYTSFWSVDSDNNVQFDNEGNPYFEGKIKSSGSDTNIRVTSNAVKTKNGYKSNKIWVSKEYQKAIESN